MGIDEINAMGAGIVCGGIEIESVVRKGSVLLCDSVTFPIEKVFVEFEDEHLAISFVEGIKTETAIIALDEDTSINAAPRELQEKSTNWRRFLVPKRGLKKCLPYYGKTTGFMAKTLPPGKRPELSVLQSCTMMA